MPSRPMHHTRRASASFNALVYLARRFVKKARVMIKTNERGEEQVPKLTVVSYGDETETAAVADASCSQTSAP